MPPWMSDGLCPLLPVGSISNPYYNSLELSRFPIRLVLRSHTDAQMTLLCMIVCSSAYSPGAVRASFCAPLFVKSYHHFHLLAHTDERISFSIDNVLPACLRRDSLMNGLPFTCATWSVTGIVMSGEALSNVVTFPVNLLSCSVHYLQRTFP